MELISYFPDVWKTIYSKNRRQIPSFAQWFEEWKICEHSVLLWYRTCIGRKVPLRQAANLDMTCHLSSSRANSTLLLPFSAIVQSPVGTRLMPVWLRLTMRLSGILSRILLSLTHFCIPHQWTFLFSLKIFIGHASFTLGCGFAFYVTHSLNYWCSPSRSDFNVAFVLHQECSAVSSDHSLTSSHNNTCCNKSSSVAAMPEHSCALLHQVTQHHLLYIQVNFSPPSLYLHSVAWAHQDIYFFNTRTVLSPTPCVALNLLTATVLPFSVESWQRWM